jgi:HAD superfamily hydrolase (TIGR01484 family)
VKAWSTFSDASASKVLVVFTDIDDTLTTEGRLTHQAYKALWDLHHCGIKVIPVTGRPAGWCDHFARMWPIDGIVGENGAFYYRFDPAVQKLIASYVLSDRERSTLQKRLAKVQKKILKQVPGAAVASDQAFRIHDLAIDFCEDVAALSKDEIQKIVDIFEAEGARAKVSSIHVNGWFGTWDKLSMIKRIARDVLNMDLDKPAHNKRAVYVGDSPNDEPAFAFFSHGIGVANIRHFETQLKSPPRYVTQKRGGAGFLEVAKKLIRARKKS